ncbi:MAG: TRZ/ATZ family hydrolase [Gammaproteobacteria bacterium]|nr:TRZ/ATZ family hydrolase [Gammaproteobacteria bacterium]
MQTVDQIIKPRWLAPIDAAASVLEDHAVAIAGDRIVAVDSCASITARYRAPSEAGLDGHVLMPGLINAHTHAAMTLLRGYADDLPLMEWLSGHIWPAEEKWVDAEYVEIGTDLALIEMIRGGTTCFNDMYFFPGIAAARAEQAGMRACVGMIVLDVPSVWAQDADEYIRKGLELRDATRHSSLITTAFAPHAPYTVSDRPLERICTLADELECGIHMHVHETAHEIEQSVGRYGIRPLERLGRLGLLGPRLIAVHMTQLLPGEIDAVAEHGVKVVHCPQSNLKLASGMCPAAKLLESGVSVAIGTDGASSNNDLDMLGELQTASLLAKGASQNPSALPAHDALTMATLGGAEALGLERITGSIVAGKKADLIAIDLSEPATQPVYHPLSQIVYSAGRHQVSDVWVGGKRLLENRRLTTLDEEQIVRKAAALGRRIGAGKP